MRQEAPSYPPAAYSNPCRTATPKQLLLVPIDTSGCHTLVTGSYDSTVAKSEVPSYLVWEKTKKIFHACLYLHDKDAINTKTRPSSFTEIYDTFPN